VVILRLAYAISLPTVTGFLFVSYFVPPDRKQCIYEKLFLGFGLGAGLLTLEMFIAGWLGIPFSLSLFSAMQLLTIMCMAGLLSKSGHSLKHIIGIWPHREKVTPIPKVTLPQLLLGVFFTSWILLKLFFVIDEGARWPVYAWDDLFNWSSGAKYFFYAKGLALDQSSEHFFGSGYRTFLNYPLHVPLLQVWFSLCLGSVNEVLMKYWNVVYFISMVGIVFFATQRECSLLVALLTAFFLSSVPLLTFHAIDAYADLPLSYYALGSVVCFRRCMNACEDPADNTYGSFVLMGAFTAFCLWTKLEGGLFCLAFSGTVLLYLLTRKGAFKSFAKRCAAYAIPLCIVGIPWLAFLSFYHITGRGLEHFLTAGLHVEVIPMIVNRIVYSANFNLIFIFLPLIIILGRKAILQSELQYLLLPILTVLLLYLFIYLTTDNFKYVMDLTSVNRNLLTVIPMMYYASGLIVAQLLEKQAQAANSLS
jgi:hypothetical protein